MQYHVILDCVTLAQDCSSINAAPLSYLPTDLKTSYQSLIFITGYHLLISITIHVILKLADKGYVNHVKNT